MGCGTSKPEFSLSTPRDGGKKGGTKGPAAPKKEARVKKNDDPESSGDWDGADNGFSEGQKGAGDSPKVRSEVGTCVVCGGGIPRGDHVEFGSDLFHENCFNCSKCGNSLEGAAFFQRAGRVFCAECDPQAETRLADIPLPPPPVLVGQGVPGVNLDVGFAVPGSPGPPARVQDPVVNTDLGFKIPTSPSNPSGAATAEKEPLANKSDASPAPSATSSAEKPLLVFVLGGPGSGKGTQCARLVEDFGFEHLSAGDLLRAEMESGSEHGDMISTMIKEGAIVPAEVTVGLLGAAMEKSSRKRFLIDGFPRNEENNSVWLRLMADKVDFKFVLSLDCPEEVLEQRLLKRGETSGRADDNIESIRKRFRTFTESTAPVIKSYEDKSQCVRVSSEAAVDEVWQAVQRAFAERGIEKDEGQTEPARDATEFVGKEGHENEDGPRPQAEPVRKWDGLSEEERLHVVRTRKILLVHGTMEGGATAIAEDLAGRLGAAGISAPDGLTDMKVKVETASIAGNDCDLDKLAAQDIVIMVMTTATKGSPPENFHELFALLQAAAESGESPLAGVPHAMIGFGNSIFGEDEFHKSPKEVEGFLTKLGSTPIMEPIYHDDRHESKRDVDAMMVALQAGLTATVFADVFPLPKASD